MKFIVLGDILLLEENETDYFLLRDTTLYSNF